MGAAARGGWRPRPAHLEALEGVEVAERALLAVVGDRRGGRGALGRRGRGGKGRGRHAVRVVPVVTGARIKVLELGRQSG